ncbi:MAG: FmdE family protein [Crenarchaeota archaeon]|nr:FmdE family protein [Thermoproteota archaeon]
MLTRVPRELLERAVSLHGHLGPFLVLGLKMGLKAWNTIGKPVACEATAPGEKPYLCVVDGLKTVMDGSISMKNGDGLSAWFRSASGSQLFLRVRASIVRKYAEKYVGTPWEGCERDAFEVAEASDEELFEP